MLRLITLITLITSTIADGRCIGTSSWPSTAMKEQYKRGDLIIYYHYYHHLAAEYDCKTAGAELVKIENEEKMDRVRKCHARLSPDDDLWVGIWNTGGLSIMYNQTGGNYDKGFGWKLDNGDDVNEKFWCKTQSNQSFYNTNGRALLTRRRDNSSGCLLKVDNDDHHYIICEYVRDPPFSQPPPPPIRKRPTYSTATVMKPSNIYIMGEPAHYSDVIGDTALEKLKQIIQSIAVKSKKKKSDWDGLSILAFFNGTVWTRNKTLQTVKKG